MAIYGIIFIAGTIIGGILVYAGVGLGYKAGRGLPLENEKEDRTPIEQEETDK